MTLPKQDIEKVAFLINLDRRSDRWTKFQQDSAGLQIPILRFSAVDAQQLDLAELRTPASIAACWMSHQEVAKKFLESSAKFCLILEDDVNLTNDSVKSLNKLWRINFDKIDLLQIGYCIHANRLSNRMNYKTQFILINLLKSLHMLNLQVVTKRLRNLYGYSFSHLESLNSITACMTFELGTHAYFISRDFAEAMVHFNSPVYLPADLAMMELAHTHAFLSYRLIGNIVEQSDSPSSISNASASPLEKLISEFERRYEN